MKKIAFTQRLIENEGYSETRDALDIRWAELCAELCMLPMILPSSYNFREYFKEIEISGIVLTGGNDLYSLSQDPLSLQRDRFEKSLLQYAIEHRIPVMGICRGMQIIAEYFGAALYPVEGHSAKKHEIIASENCRYHERSSSADLVNSYHCHAISSLPDCLHAVAAGKDGVIEAIEHTIFPIAAQMWHPERERPFKPADLTTLRNLFGDH